MKKILFSFFFLLVLAGAAYYVFDRLFPIKYKDHVEEASKKYDLDPALIYSIIKTESNFRSNVKSHKEAHGLMQLLPSTADWIAKREKIKKFDLSDPRDNIMLGSAYFRYLLNKTNGDVEKAWVAYNAGIGRLKGEKWKEISETKNYVQKLNFVYPIYKFRLKHNI
ncbi:MAG: lytic transglycosylase domain-containing protein [Sebaldella sp.]|nr:lytic transglycosylase domain-containing protein [Sebaldella sp.]